MSEFNWDNFIQELKKFQKGIENIGGEFFREFKIGTPAKEEEILEAEKKLGYRIPEDFRDILLNYSSCFKYFWNIYKGVSEEQIELPNNLKGIFAGDLHWELNVLVKFQEDNKDWIEECFPDYNDEYDRVWHNKMLFYEVGNGDYLAIELEKENYGKIAYLSHDDGDGHGYYLANNFKELLTNWSKVGCVGGEDWQWLIFYRSGVGIDPSCENAKLWEDFIFNYRRK